MNSFLSFICFRSNSIVITRLRLFHTYLTHMRLRENPRKLNLAASLSRPPPVWKFLVQYNQQWSPGEVTCVSEGAVIYIHTQRNPLTSGTASLRLLRVTALAHAQCTDAEKQRDGTWHLSQSRAVEKCPP